MVPALSRPQGSAQRPERDARDSVGTPAKVIRRRNLRKPIRHRHAPHDHPAEKQSLADLLTRLEETDVPEVTQQQIDAARDEVARNMGW
jgi:hypothetical protein